MIPIDVGIQYIIPFINVNMTEIPWPDGNQTKFWWKVLFLNALTSKNLVS